QVAEGGLGDVVGDRQVGAGDGKTARDQVVAHQVGSEEELHRPGGVGDELEALCAVERSGGEARRAPSGDHRVVAVDLLLQILGSHTRFPFCRVEVEAFPKASVDLGAEDERRVAGRGEVADAGSQHGDQPWKAARRVSWKRGTPVAASSFSSYSMEM